MLDRAQLKQDLIRDEDLRLKPYKCTSGKTTIAIGRNLDDKGISERVAYIMYEEDEADVLNDLNRLWPWWVDLPEPAQRALANMCFNLGAPRLGGFRKMLIALQEHRFEDAATEALDSRWASQVGDRATRIADLYKSCAT